MSDKYDHRAGVIVYSNLRAWDYRKIEPEEFIECVAVALREAYDEGRQEEHADCDVLHHAVLWFLDRWDNDLFASRAGAVEELRSAVKEQA